ncbi:MAG: hypothetical protein JJT75_15065 [Opitutales bacterium]|nr:hypothetical protein [Opitutales bacterium]
MPKEHDLEGFAYDPSTGKMTIDRFLSQSEQSTLAQGRREADLAAEYTGLAGQITRGSTSVEGLSTDVDARLERLESMMEAISATSE